jgi:hypothetical protein
VARADSSEGRWVRRTAQILLLVFVSWCAATITPGARAAGKIGMKRPEMIFAGLMFVCVVFLLPILLSAGGRRGGPNSLDGAGIAIIFFLFLAIGAIVTLLSILIFWFRGGAEFALGIFVGLVAIQVAQSLEFQFYQSRLGGIEVKRPERAHNTVHIVLEDDKYFNGDSPKYAVKQYPIKVFQSVTVTGPPCEFVRPLHRSQLPNCKSTTNQVSLPTSHLRFVAGCQKQHFGIFLTFWQQCLDIYEIEGATSTHLGRVVSGSATPGLMSLILAKITKTDYAMVSPKLPKPATCTGRDAFAPLKSFDVAIRATMLDAKCQLQQS